MEIFSDYIMNCRNQFIGKDHKIYDIATYWDVPSRSPGSQLSMMFEKLFHSSITTFPQKISNVSNKQNRLCKPGGFSHRHQQPVQLLRHARPAHIIAIEYDYNDYNITMISAIFDAN